MIGMILVIIRMKVLAEKRKELSQMITLLIDSIRTEKGCRRCDFYRSMEDENELSIFEEWDMRENLNSHMKSERFRVLRGAMMTLLQEPYEMVFHIVATGRKVTETTRTQRKEVIPMPNKDGKGPKGQGPKDGHGGGKGKGTNKPAGPKKGKKKGGC